MLNIVVNTPNGAEMEEEATRSLEAAKAYAIDSAEMYELAASELKDIKGRSKKLDDQMKDLLKPVKETEQKIRALFKPPLDFLQQAETIIKDQMSYYLLVEQDRQKEIQRKADEAARIERERIEKEAEEARLKAAQEAREANERIQAATAAGDIDKANEIAQQAQAAVSSLAAQAQELATAAVLVQPAVVAMAPTKTAGVSGREKWTAAVTDKVALLRFLLDERPEFLSLVNIDQGALNRQAQTMKTAMSWPGVSVTKDITIASRSA